MNKIIKGLIVTVLVVIAAEISAAVFFSVHTGSLFYGKNRSSSVGDSSPHHIAQAVFHPFAGYVLQPGRRGEFGPSKWRANNSGFQYVDVAKNEFCCDVPYAPASNEIVVGIFGGSVGSGMALQAQESDYFADVLRKARQDWRDKKIRFLNFALPGYRQPQQLTVLAHFLSIGQRFDLIINIDGFNETVTGWQNWKSGVPISYPADQLWGAWGRQLEQYKVPVGEAGYLLASWHRIRSGESRNRAPACSFALCYYARLAQASYHDWRRRKHEPDALKLLTKRSYFPTSGVLPLPNESNLYQEIAAQWQRASLGMQALAHQHGAFYIHILQPNQWYRRSGTYTPINPDHPYRWVIKPVNSGYDAFREQAGLLAKKGVNFLDLTGLFQPDQLSKAYSDDCCHFTKGGYEMIFYKTAKAAGNFQRPIP